ncbi:helix-turn-helix transcriptional regulator [Crassaminicella thermophila]|uniref:Helix-turn-helix transcriptional regulator n=1 Tax=Crassaminicella thermophila TaxID=2599308 RepID=A0A5C0SED0_CRATE|nr:helix-turn-helix transcriptional regulator [Crassaminicella thermophila]QEK11654.1 helix-turn-helix transcriptional regulator [Crassaminicella thermophila]
MQSQERLKKFRENKNLNKEQMASLLDISTSFYEKIEKGERNPSYNFIKKFKRKFPEADINYIFFNILLHEKCKNKTTA